MLCIAQRDDLHETVPHCHAADAVSVEAQKVRVQMRQRVCDVRARPGQVLAAGIASAADEVRVKLGRTETVKRNLRRQKRGVLPAEPATLADIDISGQWAETGGPNSQPFLIHDSGSTAAERVLVFSSPTQLRHLATADVWFMDGTFSTAPRIFQQLYVIRAPLGQSAVTCVYALLPGKSQAQYETVLKAVVDKCEELAHSADPSTVICDFEQAAINSVTSTLGQHVIVQGCFYHLTQSTWRKIQELGLSKAYKESDELKHFCGMLDALAFLPVTEVSEGMAFLRQCIPSGVGLENVVDLVDYFDSTYVTGSVRTIRRPAISHRLQPIRIRRIPPLFPPTVWNVHEATLAGNARTNNFCESWNNGFASLVGHNHPSLWVLLGAIQQDEATSSTAILQDARGQPPAKRVKRNMVQLQARLQQLCADRRDNRKSVEETLRGIGHNIRFQAA